ncbi:UNVERIFIED_CONTAM: hypothetical protein K2H54_056745 [Gekko kuhli]
MLETIINVDQDFNAKEMRISAEENLVVEINDKLYLVIRIGVQLPSGPEEKQSPSTEAAPKVPLGVIGSDPRV